MDLQWSNYETSYPNYILIKLWVSVDLIIEPHKYNCGAQWYDNANKKSIIVLHEWFVEINN